MNESESQRKYSIVPPSELRCVWMTAGVLSYQLCDRKLECEQCPLDLALRQRLAGQETERAHDDFSTSDKTSEESSGAMLYGRKHVWVRASGEHSVRVGLEPGLASVLLSPKAVVLPAIGEHVFKDKVCAWIVLEGGTLPIITPVAGKVRLTNSSLSENPHAVCLSPLGQGWLFELQVDAALEDDASLLRVPEASLAYAEDERRFQTLLSAELTKGGAIVGATLADGGQPLKSLSEMLGPTKYFKLVRNAFT
jgi:glycine cleavage system H protein